VGFVIADIYQVRYDVEDAIEKRHEEIGTNNATCLTEAVERLRENESELHGIIKDAVIQMHRSIKNLVDTHFYPLLYELDIDSNALQLRVLNVTKLNNVVTEADLIQENLNKEVAQLYNFGKTSILRIENEFKEIAKEMNEMKDEMFHFMKYFFEVFQKAAQEIIEFVGTCEADEV
jgi:DNA-directed RNA polymerase alpha subunit